MTETIFEKLAAAVATLKLDFSSEEFALYAEEHELSELEMAAVENVFTYLSEKKQQATVHTLLRLSRLPTKAPRTFENFDFSLLKGRDVERLKALPSLSAIYSHRNLAFIGPAGTGKTHLAQAFGYACCQHGMKTYFIKASELRDRFLAAKRSGKADSCLNALVRPSCLIIDEIGHCEFDKECTRMFFDLIDRRYNKEGNFNMIFTSNKNPALWREDFNEDTTLLCALDRIFDDAMDVIRDSIESRADDVCRAKEELRTTPVYPHSAAYASEHGEMAQYNLSYQANSACKEAIEQTISAHYAENRLDTEAAVKDVLEKFGTERVQFILANTIQHKNHDGRISQDNKAWAKTIPMLEDSGASRHSDYLVVDQVNPGLTDLFTRQFRKVAQEQQKSSVLQKLKQELPAHKSAAPKKREPER